MLDGAVFVLPHCIVVRITIHSHKRLRKLSYLLYKIHLTFVSMFDHVYRKQKPFTREMLYFLLVSSPQWSKFIKSPLSMTLSRLYHVLLQLGLDMHKSYMTCVFWLFGNHAPFSHLLALLINRWIPDLIMLIERHGTS